MKSQGDEREIRRDSPDGWAGWGRNIRIGTADSQPG